MKDDSKQDEDKILKDIPSGRLRQMLMDSNDLEDLRNLISSMKTSDVSSESDGKKKKSQELVDEIYGTGKTVADLEKLLSGSDNKRLIEDIESDKELQDMLMKYWKEPLYTLLHIIHYGKGGKK